MSYNNKDLGKNCYFSNDIGEKVFLTKETAEQKLTELLRRSSEIE